MDDVSSNLVLNNRNPSIKNLQNGTTPKGRSEPDQTFIPPDGGVRAWIVVACSFFCNGILFGIINSNGVLHKQFTQHLETLNDTEASGKAALAGSLSMGTLFLVSPVSGILTDAVGLRTTTFLGGAIAAGGMLFSSFCGYNIEALYFTFGIMFGLGGALAYTPSLAILGHYFKKYLGIANGIVTAGSSTFTIVMSYFIDWLLRGNQLALTFRVLAVLVSVIMGCAFLFKPLNVTPQSKKNTCHSVFNTSIWKNPKYVIWAIVVPLSLFGYFVPYVHMPKFVETVISKEADGKLPVTCIGITSLLGRIIFGYISDFPGVNCIYLQQLAFFSMGVLTMLMPACKESFAGLIIISLAMGLFDGCFISLLGTIAFQLCGPNGGTQAIGFLLGTCSVPLTLGPYMAGILYDKTESYERAFIYAGIPPIIGSLALFLIKCVKSSEASPYDPAQQPLQYQKNLNSERLNGALDVKTNGKIPSSGRLIPQSAKSSCVWCDRNGNCTNKRCYSYSVL